MIHCEPTLTNIRKLADYILETDSLADIKQYVNNQGFPLFFHVAMKLAESKEKIKRIDNPIHVSVIHAMYHEDVRMKSKQEHPDGEDFINVKNDQLKWLFDSNNKVQWELLMVDDGCPRGSGSLAQKIIDQKGYDNIKVLYLEEAIREKNPQPKPSLEPMRAIKGDLFIMACGMPYKKERRITI
ncbi:MAG: hypothetical protein ACLFP2_00180 [Candidatus Woesearchaeota archaeon]